MARDPEAMLDDELPASSTPTVEQRDVNEDELVGPGRYPLRIQPAAALMPGVQDPKRLMAVWFIRKSFYWLFFVGYTLGTVVALINHEDNQLDVDWTSPSSVREALLSPWSALLIAIIVRFVNGWVALALAYPLAIAHEPNLSQRSNVGSSIGKFFDRLHVARAYRSLRWTHHVREVALRRLGDRGEQLRRFDPVLDVVNIVSGVLSFIVVIAVTVATAT